MIVVFLKRQRTINVSPYHRDLYNFFIRELGLSTDHQMIMSELKGGEVRRNRRYFKGKYIWTILAPKGGPIQEEEAIFTT